MLVLSWENSGKFFTRMEKEGEGKDTDKIKKNKKNRETPTSEKCPFFWGVIAYRRASEESLGRTEWTGRCQSYPFVPDNPCCWFCRDARTL